jgi:hypothetical protein
MEAGSDIADFSRRHRLVDELHSANRGDGSGSYCHPRGVRRSRASAAGCAMPGSECTRQSCSAHLMLATPRSKRWGISYQAARGQRARPINKRRERQSKNRPTSVARGTPIVARLHFASPSFQGFCFGLMFSVWRQFQFRRGYCVPVTLAMRRSDTIAISSPSWM